MKPLEFPLLADENIHPDVVSALRERRCDVTTVVEAGLGGAADDAVLRHAVAEGRVVCTHDSDFGSLAFQGDEPFVGIIYLRPGHIDPRFVLEMIDAVGSTAGEVEAPFIIVAVRSEESVRVRLRSALGRAGE